MSRINRNQVECEINGEDYTLEPTLNAMSMIERRFGSVTEALDKMRNPSLDDVTLIIAAGASVPGKQRDRLKEDIFNDGIMNVNPKAVEYLVSLLNPSGDEAPEGKGDGEGEGKP